MKACASRTALRILYKSSSEYLEILIVVTLVVATLVATIRVSAMEGFVPKDPASWLDNLSSNLRGGEESGEATERVIKEHFRWERPRL